MPKNKKGGRNFKKRKKAGFASNRIKQLILKDNTLEQDYGYVDELLGDLRVRVIRQLDGTKLMCKIRGNMRKKIWINKGDLVLVGLREWEHDKGDIIHKYTQEQFRQLSKMGEVTRLRPDGNDSDDEDHDSDLFDENAGDEDFFDEHHPIDLNDL